MSTSEVWYRYQDRLQFAAIEGVPGHARTTSSVDLFAFQVMRKWPNGVVLKVGDRLRTVLYRTPVRFAWPTQEEALQCFLRRMQLKIERAEHRVRHMRAAIEIAQGPTVQPKQGELPGLLERCRDDDD